MGDMALIDCPEISTICNDTAGYLLRGRTSFAPGGAGQVFPIAGLAILYQARVQPVHARDPADPAAAGELGNVQREKIVGAMNPL